MEIKYSANRRFSLAPAFRWIHPQKNLYCCFIVNRTCALLPLRVIDYGNQVQRQLTFYLGHSLPLSIASMVDQREGTVGMASANHHHAPPPVQAAILKNGMAHGSPTPTTPRTKNENDCNNSCTVLHQDENKNLQWSTYSEACHGELKTRLMLLLSACRLTTNASKVFTYLPCMACCAAIAPPTWLCHWHCQPL